MLAIRCVISAKRPNAVRLRRMFLSSSTSDMENIIKVGKYNINYMKVGNGPHNVLCAPGALGSIWTDFKPQVEGFDREKFTLVVWDPPGFGKSRPPDREFATNFYEQDADIAYEFMKELKIPKYSLLGWSDGGISSIILAAKYPQVVERLVVWGANSFMLPTEVEGYKKIKNVSAWSNKMREPMIELYGEERFTNYFAKWVDTMVELFQLKDGNICSEFLPKIKCPTFILYGEKDPLVDNVHVSHLHTHITGSRLQPTGPRVSDDENLK
ncbi:unnamed protein product [Leptidea sinapis]|uniref:AB hydrolase-1 domain-containing protein n=1 Tax=Leptidea sinapis TaxID=189913 RepID=A0A5E4PVZ9_9NEOP|nr:unnamed protein product [Leptidea sinapis]